MIYYCDIFHSCISVNYYLSMYIVGYYLYHQFLIVQVYITKLAQNLHFVDHVTFTVGKRWITLHMLIQTLS